MKIFSSLFKKLPGLALVALALVAGCVKSDPPQFRLNMFEIAKNNVTDEQQRTLANVLEAMYGTPDKPFVLPETKLNLSKIQLAAGPVSSDQHGRERGLFRRHCVHCHGVTGDGAGPTASILNPYPRDYRPGLFKFKSTERAAMPTDADLRRILEQGVPDTAMPSFALLPNDELDSLVEYVKYLSMRGKTEIDLIAAIADLGEGEKLALTREKLVDEVLDGVAKKWQEAPEKVIAPVPKPDTKSEGPLLAQSIDAGRNLFYGAKANCFKCHGASALGDGQTTDYDDWTKPIVELAKDTPTGKALAERRAQLSSGTDESGQPKSAEDKARDERELAALDLKVEVLQDLPLPVRTILPRNLRAGVYRGGRRPLDIYRRLYAGINGVPMPAVGPATPGAQGTLTPDEIWHLVDYVLSLPYEDVSRPPKALAAAKQKQTEEKHTEELASRHGEQE